MSAAPLDIALVSCKELSEPDHDAPILAAALAEAGLSARVMGWDDPDADWSRARLAIYRSSWNYPLYYQQFLAWAEATDRVTELWNPLPVVRWSAHKSYLLALQRAGLPIVPTALIERGSGQTLEAIAAERGWRDVVVKPAVSASSFRTRRFDLSASSPGRESGPGPGSGSGEHDQAEAGEAHLRALAAERDVLVQQYLPSVNSYGERDIIWIDGEITHAVHRDARFTDEQKAVSVARATPTQRELALAKRAIEVAKSATNSSLLYGRIDMVPGPDGEPLLMELELIEPSFFFTECPEAAPRFIAAIRRRLAQL